LVLLPVLGAVGLVNLHSEFHPQPVFTSDNEVDLVYTTDCWIFLFNPVCQMVSFDGEVESVDIQC
jgi:hypothetical protein